MIDLKRNSKKELVTATGRRSRRSSIYEPHQTEDFKISRGKFSDFLSCRRCFYMDRVIGLESPKTPGWTLNETTDLLLKKEFDRDREAQQPHRLFMANGLDHLVPFAHPDMDRWRDSLHHGLSARFENSNIILTGGVDDIWFNTKNQKLVIADYKSQASNIRPERDAYLSDPFKSGYKIQMDFYAYLLSLMEFEVDETCYFLVCNANRRAFSFSAKLEFEEALIPYRCDPSWIPEKVREMCELLNSEDVPNGHPSCRNCAYAAQRAKFEDV